MCEITLMVTDNQTNQKYKYNHTFDSMKTAKTYRNIFAESVKNYAKVNAHYKLQ